MDLFTYLMAKNGNNSSVHGDLFSYLLGKAQGGGGQIKTASGVTINIPNAKNFVSFMMTKESTQETTRGVQLFDKNNANILDDYYVASKITYDSNSKTLYVPCNANTTYTIQKISSARFVVATTNSTPVPNISVSNRTQDNTATKITITTNSTAQYIVVYYYNAGADTLTEQEILNSIQIEEGSTATPYEEYTGGQPSPNPNYPQEVNVVEGYRNLFDKDNANILNAQINNSSVIYSSPSNRTTYINAKPNTTYTITKLSTDSNYNYFVVGTSDILPEIRGTVNQRIENKNGELITITTDSQTNYLVIWFYSIADNVTEQQMLDSIMIVESDQELPYVPYGNNYIAVNVSDGTNTNKYPIPLNNNEIVGIGDYKDELKVDKSGNVFINKKTGKVVLNGTENWSRANASDGNRFLCSIIRDKVKVPASTSTIADILCDRFISESANDTNSSINGMGIANSGNIVFYYDVIKNYTTSQTKEWFSLNNTEVYYALATPKLIDLQTTVDIKLFKGVNNISNSEDGYMTIEYK